MPRGVLQTRPASTLLSGTDRIIVEIPFQQDFAKNRHDDLLKRSTSNFQLSKRTPADHPIFSPDSDWNADIAEGPSRAIFRLVRRSKGAIRSPSSAVASGVCRMVNLSVLAVLRFDHQFNLVGAWTRRSLGFSPLRIRLT